MGKYSELYLEIRNIAKTTERMEKIIQNTSLRIINRNKLIEFCRLNVNHVYSVFGSKDEFLHIYLILKFLEGKHCPICNSKKTGMLKKKCPKHSSLSLDKYASRLKFNVQKLKEWDAKFYHIDTIWPESIPTKNIISLLNTIMHKNIQIKTFHDIFDFVFKYPDRKISIGTITVLNEDDDYCSFEDGREAFNALLENKMLLSEIDPDVGFRVMLNEDKLEDIRDFIESNDDQSSLLNDFDSFFKVTDSDINNEEDEIDPDSYYIDASMLIRDLTKYKQKNSDIDDYLIITTNGMDYYYDPSEPQDMIDLGFTLFHVKDYDLSLEIILRAIELDPDRIEVYNFIGVIYSVVGDYNKAKKYFRIALDMNKNYADVWFNMSILSEKSNQFDEAIEFITNAANLDPFSERYKKRAGKLRNLDLKFR